MKGNCSRVCPDDLTIRLDDDQAVHKTVDNMSRTAYTVEESVLDPILELGALYRGFERGIRAAFGSKAPGQISSFSRTTG